MAERRILIVGGHRLLGHALGRGLERNGLVIVGVANTEEEALSEVKRHQPELVLLEPGIGGSDAVGLGKRILQQAPSIRVIILLSGQDPAMRSSALAAGFHTIVIQDVSMQGLASSIKAALAGDVELFQWPPRASPVAPGGKVELQQSLSPREREVLTLLARGATGDDIARRLGISQHTVRTHVDSVLSKCHAHSRLEAVAVAIRNGLIDPASDSEAS